MAAAKHLSFAKHPVGAITAPALQLSTIKPHAQHFLPPIFTSKLPFFYPSIFNHENHEKYESCALPISLPQRHRGTEESCCAQWVGYYPAYWVHLRISATIHRITADLLYLQYQYVLRYAVDNNDTEGYPVICTNSHMYSCIP